MVFRGGVIVQTPNPPPGGAGTYKEVEFSIIIFTKKCMTQSGLPQHNSMQEMQPSIFKVPQAYKSDLHRTSWLFLKYSVWAQ